MANNKYNKYVGARYVPKFDGEWDKNKTYEPLIIVSNQGNSYTSKTFIPIGVDITNTKYWACTGNYNAQIEYYKQAVDALKKESDIKFNNLDLNVNEINTKINDIMLNVKTFKCSDGEYVKGDGIHDDTTGIKTAIEFALSNANILYFPKGTYLITQTIDFTAMSNPKNFTPTLIGQSPSNTYLKGGKGLNKMFIYNPVDKTNIMTFCFKNFSVISADPFNDLTLRADLKAFEFLASPYSTFENLNFLGISWCIHLQNCWLSKLKNISINRVRKGITIDGTNPKYTGLYGYADECYLENIVAGGWLNEYGLYLLGTKATKINGFNSEGGYTGNAIKIEACHEIELDTLYFEHYQDAPTIKIKGSDTLNSISDFSTNITIKNAHVYNQTTSFIQFGKGVDGVKIMHNNFLFNYDALNYDSTPILNLFYNLFGFDMGQEKEIGNYFKNISVLDNIFYSPKSYDIVFAEGYSTCFIEGINSFINTENISYYSPSFRKGTTVKQLANANYSSFYVDKEGSFGELQNITGSISNGSNIATLNNVSSIIVGTYINIGTLTRVKVLSKNPTTNKIVIGENSNKDIVNEQVVYCPPVLIYNYKNNQTPIS